MYKFIRKYQKKLLAVFAAGLMIAFIWQTAIPSGPLEQHSGITIGQIGDDKLTLAQLRRAEQEWDLLSRTLLTQTGLQPPQPQFVPLARLLPRELLEQMHDHPELYLLLQEEARRMGVQVSSATVQEWLNTRIAVQVQDRVLPVADAPPELGDAARATVANLLAVLSAFDRAADVVKISQPLLDHAVVGRMQLISVQAAQFDAREFEASAPTPTSEQLAEFFATHAGLDPDSSASESNPLGFGYRFSNRVKVQYISIPRDAVEKAVKATKDDYAWELDAHKYYLRNAQQFPGTQPAAAQSMSSSDFSLTSPATAPSAAGPTTRPFEEVREELLRRVTQPEIDRLTHEIQLRIQNAIAADYEKYLAANPNPATAPATTQPIAIEPRTATPSALSVPFESYDYLRALAEHVQKEFGILPATASVGEFKSAEELNALPAIGKAALDRNDFGSYAVVFAEPFVPEAQRKIPLVLSLFEASAPLTDPNNDDVYIFRIAATDPSHTPTDMTGLADRVSADWKKQWAFDQAKDAARKLVEAAKASGLKVAAGARPVLSVGPFDEFSPAPLAGLELAREAAMRFRQQAFRLVADLARHPGTHPLGVIDLPREMRVYATELESVTTAPMPSNSNIMLAQAAMDLRREFAQPIAMSWFTYPAVVSRLGYVDATRGDKRPADTQ